MSSVTAAGVTTTYTLDALGQRIGKSNLALTRIFFYDEGGHLLGEYDGSGALIQETVWLNDTPVATLRPNGAGVSIYYVHTDHLNTPRRLSRPSDNVVVWRWDSDPFGTSSPNEDPDGDSALVAFNLRFAGQYFDAESGLNYNYMRDYDPATGRYIESDPIGLDGGINTYAYVGSDPLDNIDPLGLEYGAAYRAELRHDGWRGPPPPGSAGLVRPEVKSYLCKLIDQCNGDLQCVWRHIDQARKSDLKNGSWYNPTWREAENWAYTADMAGNPRRSPSDYMHFINTFRIRW